MHKVLPAQLVSDPAQEPLQAAAASTEQAQRRLDAMPRRAYGAERGPFLVDSPWCSTEDLRAYLRLRSRAAAWLWAKRKQVRGIHDGRRRLYVKADVERALAAGAWDRRAGRHAKHGSGSGASASARITGDWAEADGEGGSPLFGSGRSRLTIDEP